MQLVNRNLVPTILQFANATNVPTEPSTLTAYEISIEINICTYIYLQKLEATTTTATGCLQTKAFRTQFGYRVTERSYAIRTDQNHNTNYANILKSKSFMLFIDYSLRAPKSNLLASILFCSLIFGWFSIRFIFCFFAKSAMKIRMKFINCEFVSICQR